MSAPGIAAILPGSKQRRSLEAAAEPLTNCHDQGIVSNGHVTETWNGQNYSIGRLNGRDQPSFPPSPLKDSHQKNSYQVSNGGGLRIVYMEVLSLPPYSGTFVLVGTAEQPGASPQDTTIRTPPEPGKKPACPIEIQTLTRPRHNTKQNTQDKKGNQIRETRRKKTADPRGAGRSVLLVRRISM